MKEFFKKIVAKLASTKLWITLWSIVMSTKMIWDGKDGTALIILLAVPLSYMGLNVAQDLIFRGRHE
jgi:hypothetical protein